MLQSACKKISTFAELALEPEIITQDHIENFKFYQKLSLVTETNDYFTIILHYHEHFTGRFGRAIGEQ